MLPLGCKNAPHPILCCYSSRGLHLQWCTFVPLFLSVYDRGLYNSIFKINHKEFQMDSTLISNNSRSLNTETREGNPSRPVNETNGTVILIPVGEVVSGCPLDDFSQCGDYSQYFV